MSQEMNQLPIRHTAASSAVSTVAGAAGGAIRGAAKGALYTFGLVAGLPALGAVIGGVMALGGGVFTGIALGALIGFAPAITIAVGGLLTAGAVWTLATPLAVGATIFGALGLAKGAGKAHEAVQQQSANANVLDAQLQAAAMDAQARMAQAQAQSYAPQPRVRHVVPETMHAASPHIQASNDNEHHGTVAQAPERQVGHA